MNRNSVVAGSFYPGDPKELRVMLEGFFRWTKKLPQSNKLKALIVPHAGYVYSGQTAAWGYRQIIKRVKQHLVLVGPSHHFPFAGLAGSTASAWMTPLGKVTQRPPPAEPGLVVLNDEIHAPEHNLEVQLPFLQYHLKDFSISCFLTGTSVNAEQATSYLLAHFSKSFFVFSSDLSHYLPDNQARTTDRATIEAILTGDTKFLCSQENLACGLVGILVLLTMAKEENWKAKLITYTTSAAAFGQKAEVVGYASIGFFK